MAFIYQESGFRARAKPARSKLLWVLPGPRLSSAYGYAQAVDSTWNDYMLQSGNWDARRDRFADAIDFVGWYHEGNSGFARGSFENKPWLLDTGSRVQANAERFDEQFSRCQDDLDKNWFFRLIS
jgi:hypothetical protein